MKKLALIGLVASLAATGTCLAQTAPPPPTPNPAMRQQFRQMHSQMQQIRTAERSQILGALTAANRSLLATVAGQLATSVNPDYDAAANRLDAALSAGEKQKILSAAESARSKQRALMQSMRQQFEQYEGANERRHAGPPPGAGRHMERTPDAGRVLLRLAVSGPGMGMMKHAPMHPGFE